MLAGINANQWLMVVVAAAAGLILWRRHQREGKSKAEVTEENRAQKKSRKFRRTTGDAA
jgi:hypothetical protein